MNFSMNPNDDVSVVIPVFEAANFITDTLETVATQTTLPLEVVIVDDGSQDNTCDVIESFSKANPQIKIRLLREAHCGPGNARNAGVNAAKGSWIAFLDSDDLWHSNKLEQMAVAHQTNPEANILCHNEIHRRFDNTDSVTDYSIGFRSDDSVSAQLFTNNRFSTSAVVCRRDMILACGGFDSTLPNAQDYELWLRMSPGMKVLFVKDVLGIYVYRAGNISSGKAWRRYKNVVRVLHRHRKFVTPIAYVKILMRMSAAYVYHGTIQTFKNPTRTIKVEI